MTRYIVLLGLLASSAILSLHAQSPALTLGVTGAGNSAPWVAASGSLVTIAWGAVSGSAADVYLAVSRDGARTFAAPVRVNANAGEARINGEIAPRVALASRAGGGEPEIVVLWNARGTPNAIKIARSTDGGRTFGPPAALQGPGAEGDRGWQSLVLDASGRAHAIWLDHRGLAAAKREGTGHQAHDGVAMAQRSGLYYAADGGAARELFPGVCYCCKTAMAAGPSGELFAAWRHVFAGNFRDMAFTRSRDGGRTFGSLVRVHEDGWSINGCPDDGPAMAVESNGAVHLVWPTVLGGSEGALHYAVARDGERFAAPIRVPTLGGPKPSHPQIALAGGRIYVAWDEVRNGVRGAAVREVITGGGSPRFGDIVSLGADGQTTSYPVMAPLSGGIVTAWTVGTGEAARIGVRVITR